MEGFLSIEQIPIQMNLFFSLFGVALPHPFIQVKFLGIQETHTICEFSERENGVEVDK